MDAEIILQFRGVRFNLWDQRFFFSSKLWLFKLLKKIDECCWFNVAREEKIEFLQDPPGETNEPIDNTIKLF